MGAQKAWDLVGRVPANATCHAPGSGSRRAIGTFLEKGPSDSHLRTGGLNQFLGLYSNTCGGKAHQSNRYRGAATNAGVLLFGALLCNFSAHEAGCGGALGKSRDLLRPNAS